MKYFDTHIHLNIEPIKSSFDTLTKLYKDQDIWVNIIGTTLPDSILAVEQANSFPQAYCSIGLHPVECYDVQDDIINELEKLYLSNKDKIIAIGECGLDYHYPNTNKYKQQLYFEKQLELAIKYHLPVILHIRDAHLDAIATLKKYIDRLASVIIHCYSESLEFAKQYVSMGCYISFSGIITFKNATALRSVVSSIDENYILSETDAPWLSPEPVRGKINDAQYMIHINQCLADVKHYNLDKMNKILLTNAINALKLKEF